jgi:hypothetical protein
MEKRPRYLRIVKWAASAICVLYSVIFLPNYHPFAQIFLGFAVVTACLWWYDSRWWGEYWRMRRSWLRWVCHAGCVLIIAAWAISLRWVPAFQIFIGGATFVLSLGDGEASLLLIRGSAPTRPDFTLSDNPNGLNSSPSVPSCHRVDLFGSSLGTLCESPLWLPFLLLLVRAAAFFLRDCRHLPQNACRACGYNLTGNVSGRCPECGLDIGTETRGRSMNAEG